LNVQIEKACLYFLQIQSNRTFAGWHHLTATTSSFGNFVSYSDFYSLMRITRSCKETENKKQKDKNKNLPGFVKTFLPFFLGFFSSSSLSSFSLLSESLLSANQ
jgi:hypothetical protein